MKFLIFTTDCIPLPELPTSGTALRTWGLGQGLIANGHEVIYSVPRNALITLKKQAEQLPLSSETRATLQSLEECAFDAKNQASLIAEHNPDAILCGHWPAMMLSHKPQVPLIIDLAGPHMLERHYQGSADSQGAVAAKLAVLSTADYFIVSGRAQRLYFLSYLLRAEVPQAESRIVTIPMPLDPALIAEPHQFSEDCYPRFIFGGVFLPWQNPAPGLRGVAQALDTYKRGSLTLVGGKHPNYPIKAGLAQQLFSELEKHPRVEKLPLLPYGEFEKEMQQAHVAVDLMEWNLERQLALTIRSTTYLASGLPVIYNNYADLSTLIDEYDAGWTIAPDDETGLTKIFAEIFDNPEVVKTKGANAKQLARENFSWDASVSPLLALINRPVASRLRENDIIIDYPDSAELDITANHPVRQYFCVRLPGLSRIEVRMATHDRTSRLPLTLELFEVANSAPSARSLRATTAQRRSVAVKRLQGDQVQNNDWLAFDFEPVKDSAGKTFLLELRSDAATAQQSVSPWALKGSPYPLLELYHGENRLAHTGVCMKTSCSVLASS